MEPRRTMLLDDEGPAFLLGDAALGLGRSLEIALVMISGETRLRGGHGSAPGSFARRLAQLLGALGLAADALLQRFHQVDDIVALGPRRLFLLGLGDLALLAFLGHQRL